MTVDLDAEDVLELEAMREAQPVRVTRSALIRAALRKGLAAIRHDGGNAPQVRCD